MRRAWEQTALLLAATAAALALRPELLAVAAAAPDGQEVMRNFYAVEGVRSDVPSLPKFESHLDQQRRRQRRSPLEENPEEASSFDQDLLNGGFEQVDVKDEKINDTIREKFNETKTDEYKYYEPKTVSYDAVWVDLDALNGTSGVRVTEHPMLSAAYRRAATIGLNFSFPFYGHDVNNITIATGGFLYTGKYVHSWLAATQYIAPLMANFDTSRDETAKIRYADNGTHLIVEWSNVLLQGGDVDGVAPVVLNQKPEVVEEEPAKPEGDDGDDGAAAKEKKDGGGEDAAPSSKDTKSESKAKEEGERFTFQAILHKTGDITFAYKTVPKDIEHIKDEEHPVKVGLSDAYIIDRTIFFVRRKTIYEYHRVSMKNREIGSKTAIHFRALPTCNMKTTCEQCLGDQDVKNLKCKWCAGNRHCSDGVDRKRQAWLNSGCEHRNLDKLDRCGDAERIYEEATKKKADFSGRDFADYQSGFEDNLHVETTNSVHAGLATLMVILFVFLLMLVWLCYAYFFPHTWSGQVLIKYRPTRWHWLRSEPRYTAASIHM